MSDSAFHPAADRLQAYVLGDVNPFESEFVARHLDQCPRCSALAEGMTATDQLTQLVERAATASLRPAPCRDGDARAES